MKIRTKVKAGGIFLDNHNQTLLRESASRGLKVRTHVKAGGLNIGNHSQKLVRDSVELQKR